MNYTEKQSLKTLWWLMLPIIIAISIQTGYWLTEADPIVKENRFNELIIALVVGILVLVLYSSMSLKTKVDTMGITFSFKPFVKEKYYTWADLEKVWVRKYKPLREYGGWGFRIGFGKGKAYSVWGRHGLQLIFKNNKRLLIGTQNQEELANFLKNLKEKHAIEAIADAELIHKQQKA